ncbi:MAG: DUF2905 domain-containing protein [Bacillota bacterium]|nr:MAG: DUF2905 domain-containing protein [Bacillota bacterium]
MNGEGLDALGRLLVGAGVVLVAAGLVLRYGGAIGLGHLPGDILIRRGATTFYFPVVTMLLVSLVLTIVLNLIRRQ